MDTPLTSVRLAPSLSPTGRLSAVVDAEAPELDAAVARRLSEAFARGSGEGLLQLGACEVGTPLPAAWSYWRELGGRLVTAWRTQGDEAGDFRPALPADLDALAAAAPPMPGGEYLGAASLAPLWSSLADAFDAARVASGDSLAVFLQQLNPAWNVVGRVHFNLAENRKDASAPFAFMATYTHRLGAQGKAQHLPLGQALREYAGAGRKQELLSLLMPVQRAAEQAPWLKALVDDGAIFHPLRWTPAEALRFLGDTARLEQAGIIVRMPAVWRSGRPARPRVTATVGVDPPAGLGTEGLLDFHAALSLDGEPLTADEEAALLAASSGLVLLRGQWVEVDRDRLSHSLQRFREAEALAAREGLAFAEAMRLLAGTRLARDDADEPDSDWSQVVAGPWLAQTLRGLRSPEALAQVDPGDALKATLRPYQQVGVRWLHLLASMGLGACLADDMGLGKTIQLLSLLLVRQRTGPRPRRPSLLVAPASLLANWAAEQERFAPSLRVMVAHPSVTPAASLRAVEPDRLAALDLVITSYGSVVRLPWLSETDWDLVVLDEAQGIKNPAARQTRAVKKLKSRARVALTGTPVENKLGDLWSIFDFVNPGLLGSGKAFTAYTRALAGRSAHPYGPLRELVRPYILRRLKTDKSVIADLPDKTEIKAWCQLSPKQAALYQQAVTELKKQLETSTGIARRGLVLGTLMRLKQLCNHPSQWLGDGAWEPSDSGKWARLRELCEEMAARQERLLVFTQFREITGALERFLSEVFGRPGLVLHGDTAVKQRQLLVKRFQEDESVPYFILSLKAGGSGLNLTAASQVIHFDRWWNPSVENQATDRAFRIGQKRHVVVHKFICRGTVEERIDALIESKRALSNDLLEGGSELDLTALSDAELLKLVSLDLNSATQE